MTGKYIGTSDIPIPNIISTELIGATTVPVADNKFAPSIQPWSIISQPPEDLIYL